MRQRHAVEMTHGFGLILGDLVSGFADEDVGPVALLVDYTREIARVVVPWRARLASEALDTRECGVLYEVFSIPVCP